MSEDDFHATDRRKYALDKAVATSVSHDSPKQIVERAETFDAFLRGDKKAE